MSGTTEDTFLPEPHTPEPHAHGNHTHGEVQGRKAGVVVASTRAAAGIYEDETGPVIIDWLTEHGFEAYPAMVVPDGEPVGAAIRALLTQRPAVVITSGGTGLSPDDRTPDVTLPLLDREIPGRMEAIRRAGVTKTPLAVLSRGDAGAAGRPSPKGVMDGLAVLDPLIGHLCDQLEGRNGH
ncbi:MAG: MogA/MoaB family molybdenum cofactor biosynthesis protein [Pseudarthrobacter sp.]